MTLGDHHGINFQINLIFIEEQMLPREEPICHKEHEI